MTDSAQKSNVFIKADGTIVRGNEADIEKAKQDADKLLRELGVDRPESTAVQMGSKEEKDDLKIRSTKPGLTSESGAILTFSKEADTNVYHFSIDIDEIGNKISQTVNHLQREINKMFNDGTRLLDKADHNVNKVKDTVDFWSDLAANIQRGTSQITEYIQKKKSELKAFTGNLNDKVQNLAKSTNNVLKHPVVQNVVDLSDVSDGVSSLAGTVADLNSDFGRFLESTTQTVIELVENFSNMITTYCENNPLIKFVQQAGKRISNILETISGLIVRLKNHVSGFLQIINGVFDKLFTAVAKFKSIIECAGFDIQLMKEALKNGTIRPTDIQTGNVTLADTAEVSSKSSFDITGAKVTALNADIAGRVVDNSKSGHIEMAGVDINALNADAAVYREGKFKRNLISVKGAKVNVGNARATLVDDREGETAVAEVAAGEVNAFNVELFGIGRRGTHKSISAQPSVSVGNVAVGIRRSTAASIRAPAPALSAFNVDLTVGRPSLQNFLNQIGSEVGLGNISIPFFGSGVIGECNGGGTDGGSEDGGDKVIGGRVGKVSEGDKSRISGGGSGEVIGDGSGKNTGGGGGKGSEYIRTEKGSFMKASEETPVQGCERDRVEFWSHDRSSENGRQYGEPSIHDDKFAQGESYVFDRGSSSGETGILDVDGDKDEVSGSKMDYETTVASILKQTVGDKVKKATKTKAKKETKQKLSREEFNKKILKEYKEGLGIECSGFTSGTEKNQTEDLDEENPLLKAKPWGEHGNIHGFNTLKMHSEKGVKKIGGGKMFGFSE